MSGWDSCNFGDRVSQSLKSRIGAGDNISIGGASCSDNQPLVSSLQGGLAVASVDVMVVGFPLEEESIDGEGGSGATGNLSHSPSSRDSITACGSGADMDHDVLSVQARWSIEVDAELGIIVREKVEDSVLLNVEVSSNS